MRRLFAGFAALALLPGCPDSRKDPITPEDGLPHPLSEADRKALRLPAALPDLLPDGPKTPVRLIRASDDAAPFGFWFSVNPQRASFVVHAMRRALARAARSTADAGDALDDTPVVAPFVYEAGASGDGRTKVEVLLQEDGERAAIEGCSALEPEELDEFLRTWREKTGATVYAATPDGIEMEIDHLPPEENAFLSDLARFTVDPLSPRDEPLPRPIRQLRDAIGRDRRIRLP